MIRTVEQYLDSLNDGRVVYCLGEKVKDVRMHPTIGTIVKASAMDFVFPNDPRYKPLFVTKNDDGEEVNFLLTAPKSAEDLLRRRDCFITGARAGGGTFLHCMGVDALSAAAVVANRMDKKLGTNYVERVEAYRKYLQKEDLGVTGAVTDVKGDRSLRASKQIQHKDFYIRLVEKNKNGIVVRGAKVHISVTPSSNEAIVLPCRAHSEEEEKDYALVFATPLNAKGITMIGVEPIIRTYGEEADWDYPQSAAIQPTECLVVFDDVFVPWERVFMCGEWQFSRDITYAFATFHRLWGASRMVAELETLTGIAALAAEYNGLEKYEHIRDKLAFMSMITETVKVLGKASCSDCQKEADSDLVVPNMMYANIAKYMFADNFHNLCKAVQDICGGLVSTAPAYKDWDNPHLRPLLEKYLAGKAGVQTEDRIRAIRLIRDLTSSYYQAANIHGEGSLAAQKMFLYHGANWDRYKAAAKRIAHIKGWKADPVYGTLPHPDDFIAPKMPPVDTSYKL